MSRAVKSYANAQLFIEQSEDEQSITLRCLGKSILRDPNEFLLPILQRNLREADLRKKRLILDFTDLVYMNSSTLTPIIKILERTRIGEGVITLRYRKALKWQDISFSALIIFQTKDNRIEIKGV